MALAPYVREGGNVVLPFADHSEVCAYGLSIASGDDIDADAWPPASDACMVEAWRSARLKPDTLRGLARPPVVHQSSSAHSATGTFDDAPLPTEADADMTEPWRAARLKQQNPRGRSWPELFVEKKLPTWPLQEGCDSDLVSQFREAFAASSVCFVRGGYWRGQVHPESAGIGGGFS